MKDDGTGKLGHGWSFVWVSRQYYVATVVKRRPRHPLAKVIVIVVVVVGCLGGAQETPAASSRVWTFGISLQIQTVHDKGKGWIAFRIHTM